MDQLLGLPHADHPGFASEEPPENHGGSSGVFDTRHRLL
jgi:hypothetical protein